MSKSIKMKKANFVPVAKRKHPVNFVPNIFKANASKSSIVASSDPFLTNEATKEYSSILSEKEDRLPNYLEHFKKFTDNVLDIPENVFEEIAKIHVGIEWKLREEEQIIEENLAKKQASELRDKHKLDKKVNSILTVHRHYVKRTCPVKIPFKTTLSHEEHEFYLRCFIKFTFQPPSNSLEEKEYEQYMGMQSRVFDEQSCFMNFSYSVSQLLLKEYNFICSAMETYIQDYFYHRCQRALAYPAHYKNVLEIPLKPQESKMAVETFQLSYIGHLLSLGTVPWLIKPNPHVKTLLAKDDSVAHGQNPDCDEDFDRNKYLYKCPVSEDPNATFLAEVHGVDVVMSASAFKTIVDNQEQPFDKEWNVPIIIKMIKVKDGAEKEVENRVIFIDKPLPQKTWSPLQKKHTFFKYSAKAKLTKHVSQHCFRMRLPRMKQRPLISYEDSLNSNFSTDEDNTSAESFSYEASPPPKNKSFSCDTSPPPPPNEPLSRPSSPAFSPSKKFIPKDDVENDLMLSSEDEEFVLDHKKAHQPISVVDQAQGAGSSSHAAATPKSNPDKLKSARNSNASKLSKQLLSATEEPNSHKSTLPVHNYSSPRPPITATPSDTKILNMPKMGFLEDLLEKQESFLAPKSAPNSSKQSTFLPPSLGAYSNFSNKSKNKKLHKCFSLKPWSQTVNTNWRNFEIKECPRGGTANVHYQLFSIEKFDQNPVQSEKEKPFKILVRHNVHGLTRFKKEPQSSKAYVIFPKVENQVFFGCEVNSLSEITQQWASLVIRPNTTLLQVRICVDSGAIVMVEEKDLNAVLKEGKQKHLDFNPHPCLSTLNILFTTLKKMGSGQYLLQHTPNTGAFMKLLKTNEGSFAQHFHFDLHKYYSDGSVNTRLYKASPWLAIDTHVITPFHMFHRKVPGTFPMEINRKLKRDERKRKRAKANKKLVIQGYE